MVMCFAVGCNHYSEQQSCKFVHFPRNPTLRLKWVDAVRRDPKEVKNTSVLCTCHFVPTGIKKDNHNRVPTLFQYNRPDIWPMRSDSRKSTYDQQSKPSETKQPNILLVDPVSLKPLVDPLSLKPEDNSLEKSSQKAVGSKRVKRKEYAESWANHSNSAPSASGSHGSPEASIADPNINLNSKEQSLQDSSSGSSTYAIYNHLKDLEYEKLFEKFDRICRICLTETKLVPCEESYKEIVRKLTSIDFSRELQYPNSICADCFRHLMSAKIIKEKTHWSTNLLQNIIKSVIHSRTSTSHQEQQAHNHDHTYALTLIELEDPGEPKDAAFKIDQVFENVEDLDAAVIAQKRMRHNEWIERRTKNKAGEVEQTTQQTDKSEMMDLLKIKEIRTEPNPNLIGKTNTRTRVRFNTVQHLRKIKNPRGERLVPKIPHNQKSEQKTQRNDSAEQRTQRNDRPEQKTPRNDRTEQKTPRNDRAEQRIQRNDRAEQRTQRNDKREPSTQRDKLIRSPPNERIEQTKRSTDTKEQRTQGTENNKHYEKIEQKKQKSERTVQWLQSNEETIQSSRIKLVPIEEINKTVANIKVEHSDVPMHVEAIEVNVKDEDVEAMDVTEATDFSSSSSTETATDYVCTYCGIGIPFEQFHDHMKGHTNVSLPEMELGKSTPILICEKGHRVCMNTLKNTGNFLYCAECST